MTTFYGPMLFLAVFLSISFFSSTNAQVTAAGGTFAEPIIRSWIPSFQLFDSNTETMTYNATGSTTARALITANEVVWAGSDSEITDAQAAENSGLQMYPIMGGGVVVVTHIPGVSTVVIPRKELSDIFGGVITHWNDARLVARNPTLASINQTITSVARSEGSGTSFIFQLAIVSMDPTFATNYGPPSGDFAVNTTTNPNLILARGNTGVMSTINVTPYSIGYVSHNVFLEFAQTPEVILATLVNKLGEEVIYSTQSAQSAFSSAVFKPNFFASEVIDIDAPGAFPIAAFTYAILDTDWNQQCQEQRTVLRFLTWALTSDEGSSTASSRGYIPLPRALADTVVDKMREATCQGESLVGQRILTTDFGAGSIALVVIIVIFFIISIGVLGIWVFRPHPRLQVVVYGYVLLAGVIMAFVAAIIWVLVPSSTVLCQLRLWLTSASVSLFLGASIGRASIIMRVFTVVVRRNKFKKQIRGLLIFLVSLCIVLAIQFVLIVIWDIVDTYESGFEQVDVLSLDVNHTCTSKYYEIWLVLELIYLLGLLGWGAFVVYSTWSVKSRVISSRWLLMHLYNCVMALAIAGMLLLIFGDTDFSVRHIVATAIVVVAASSLASFVFPDIAFPSLAASSSGGTSNTKTNTDGKSIRVDTRIASE